jgi:hypothetical protein
MDEGFIIALYMDEGFIIALYMDEGFIIALYMDEKRADLHSLNYPRRMVVVAQALLVIVK